MLERDNTIIITWAKVGKLSSDNGKIITSSTTLSCTDSTGCFPRSTHSENKQTSPSMDKNSDSHLSVGDCVLSGASPTA